MIPYNKQYIDSDDIDSVIKVLKSPLITQGNQVPKFEKKIAKICSAKFAVAVNSATSALHIACLSIGLKKDDILWTVPNTFVASANCGLYCGAKIDFVDIDNQTYNIDVKKLEGKLKEAKRKNCLPKIVVPVHFAGQPTDQQKIWNLSKIYNFKVIEDASHSLGASHQGIKVGSCIWSHMTIFSFHPVKMITTGEGGMVLTNSEQTANKIQMLRNSGITREKKLLKKGNIGPWYYEQQLLGYNYRMTDIQAALGISQVKKLNKFIKKRNEIANLYDHLLKDLPVQLPFIEKYNISSFHLYVIRLKDQSPKSYKNIFNKLRSSGIGVNLHYLPVHLQPYYKSLGFKKGDFPISENYSLEAISLPLYYGLREDDQKKVVNQLKKIIS
tara:strand:- start:767 stop:1921 length:1155 start_codon:yes stop_codon:yes gene_type:complete